MLKHGGQTSKCEYVRCSAVDSYTSSLKLYMYSIIKHQSLAHGIRCSHLRATERPSKTKR